MGRDETLATLRSSAAALQAQGVKSLALFGSTALNHARSDSDVDLLVEFTRPVSLFDLAALQLTFQRLLGVPKVDLVCRDSLHPALREVILKEAIDVI